MCTQAPAPAYIMCTQAPAPAYTMCTQAPAPDWLGPVLNQSGVLKFAAGACIHIVYPGAGAWVHIVYPGAGAWVHIYVPRRRCLIGWFQSSTNQEP